MRRGIAFIGGAALALLSAAALAQNLPTATRENGVTVLRGPHGLQSTNTGAAAEPNAVTPPLSGSTYNRGGVNATITGSGNAGGAIANPPPGAGQ